MGDYEERNPSMLLAVRKLRRHCNVVLKMLMYSGRHQVRYFASTARY